MPFDVVFYMGKPMPPFPLFNLPFPSQLFARFRRVASFERSFSHEAHNLPINCWNRQVQVLLCVSVLTPNSRPMCWPSVTIGVLKTCLPEPPSLRLLRGCWLRTTCRYLVMAPLLEPQETTPLKMLSTQCYSTRSVCLRQRD